MTIRLVLDMNLPPEWASVLAAQGWSAVHWPEVGDPQATDRTLMDWAVEYAHAVFTHDLDFGTILALTHARGPSDVQVRTQDILPDRMTPIVVAAIRQHEADLASGAIVTVDAARARVRILPI